MNFFKIVSLLLKPELWEFSNRSFSDELQMKDGSIRFYANEAIHFRDVQTGKIVYVPNVLAWLIIQPIAHRLRTKVKHNAK